MYLHEDRENFRDIIEQVADQTRRTRNAYFKLG